MWIARPMPMAKRAVSTLRATEEMGLGKVSLCDSEPQWRGWEGAQWAGMRGLEEEGGGDAGAEAGEEVEGWEEGRRGQLRWKDW